MIILDTNVLSELIRSTPAPAVLHWFATQPAGVFHVTSISVAEMLFGVERLPDGRRKTALAEQIGAMFAEDFRGRILSFDASAAPSYAAMVSRRERMGRPLAVQDGMIAAIAQVHGAEIATRDGDFAACGVSLINPWEHRA